MKTTAYHHPTDAQPVPEQWPPYQLSLVLLLSMMPYGTEYPFGQLASAVPAVSPPNFLSTPCLLVEKALTLYKHCSVITKTSLNYQHCFRHKSKT